MLDISIMGSQVNNCIEPSPTKQTIRFAGTPVNMSKLCEETGVIYSYLSHILNGHRTPSIDIAKKVATGLGMDLGEFIQAQALQKPRRKPAKKLKKAA